MTKTIRLVDDRSYDRYSLASLASASRRKFLFYSFLVLILSSFLAPMFPAPNAMSSATYPGDSIVTSPEMHYNHVKLIHAPPAQIFPWILQLGKGRGGWYLPSSFERVLPKSMHASRTLKPDWTALKVGDRVEDYGFDEKEDFFVVAKVVPNEALVYKSERYGTVFTWALILEEKGEEWSEVRLRFRGRIQRTGWQQKLLVWAGGWMDWLSTAPMLAGLKERVERAKVQ